VKHWRAADGFSWSFIFENLGEFVNPFQFSLKPDEDLHMFLRITGKIIIGRKRFEEK
jgi:hypothetical protein